MLPDINPLQLIIIFLPLLFAVTIHEVAHGYAAYRFGDPTAKMAGRLTLNPIRHMDPFGSVILPLLLKISGSPVIFGYAKPVPVDFKNLRPFRLGSLCVASAGVVTNFIAALGCAAILQGIRPFHGSLAGPAFSSLENIVIQLLIYSVIINLVLGIFNLIPIPPLDGGRILDGLLPQHLRAKLQVIEPFGFLILIVLLMTNSLDFFISFFISPLINWMLQGYL